jgi:hypothetical protein
MKKPDLIVCVSYADWRQSRRNSYHETKSRGSSLRLFFAPSALLLQSAEGAKQPKVASARLCLVFGILAAAPLVGSADTKT